MAEDGTRPAAASPTPLAVTAPGVAYPPMADEGSTPSPAAPAPAAAPPPNASASAGPTRSGAAKAPAPSIAPPKPPAFSDVSYWPVLGFHWYAVVNELVGVP